MVICVGQVRSARLPFGAHAATGVQRTSGMTTCYEQHFSSHSYVRIENKLVDASITGKIAASLESGRSVFIEDVSSNRIDGRKRIADIARRHGARCRILRFSLSEMHAWHNNLYRHLAAPVCPPPSFLQRGQGCSDAQLPPDTSRSPLVAPSEYVAVQEPTPNEGFHEIKTYNFVFSGTTEERERYSLWLGLNRAETKALEGRQKSGYSR